MIDVDLEVLKVAPPPHEVENFQEEFLRDTKYKAWRREMEEEYQRQKARGGIIDLEMEDNRFLVVTENTSGIPSTDLPLIPADEKLQQSQQQTTAVQATTTSKVPIGNKSEWPRAHSRPPRGNRWNRRFENNSKERPVSNHNVPRPSNPPNRPFQTEHNSSQARHRAEGPIHPINETTRSNGTVPAATKPRPPPGFEPR